MNAIGSKVEARGEREIEYLPTGRTVSGRKRVNPEACGRAVFTGVRWREVPDFHWTRLTAFASQMSMASLGVGVVYGELVAFAGH